MRGGTVAGVSRLGKRIVLEIAVSGSDAPYFLVDPSDDRRAAALEAAARPRQRRERPRGAAAGRAGQHAGGLRVLLRHAVPHRGRAQSAGPPCISSAAARLWPLSTRAASTCSPPTPEEFAEALRRENRTLKRALTDPRLLSGIGNAYSDEILHRARLSPFKLSQSLTDEEIARLAPGGCRGPAGVDRPPDSGGAGGFPEKVTAFRPDMAVHGKFGSPCPVCGQTVQRIVYADNECDYCPGCQTGGRILADRSLSRLLKDDWPRGTPGPGDDCSSKKVLLRLICSGIWRHFLLEWRQA